MSVDTKMVIIGDEMPRRQQMTLHFAAANYNQTRDVYGRLYNVSETGLVEDQGFNDTMSEKDTRTTATIDVRGHIAVNVGDVLVVWPSASHWIVTEVSPNDNPFNENQTCQVQYYADHITTVIYAGNQY